MDSELEQLGERIAEQAAHFDAAMHRLLVDLRDFDQRGGWHVQGAMSCAHWLSWRVGWDLVTARDRVRVARKLADFPMIDDALRRGEVSYSKVRALVRVATPENELLLLDHARLMTASQLEKLSCKYARVQRHGQQPHPWDDEQRRFVRRRDTEDGMVKIEAVLHPEEAELVWTMLSNAAARLVRDPDRAASNDPAEARAVDPLLSRAADREAESGSTWEGDDSAEARAVGPVPSRAADQEAESGATYECDDSAAFAEGTTPGSPLESSLGRGRNEVTDSRGASRTVALAPERGPGVLRQRAGAATRAFSRADALVSLAHGYVRGDQPDRSPIEVTLTIAASSLLADVTDPVDLAELGEFFISLETARRLSCDAGVVEVIESEHGVPLSVGRKRRTIAGALKRALHKRDACCVYPGCTNMIFLEGHHIKHWADGGETSLQNTALLCTHHHRFVHEYGYTIELGPDHRPRFRDPSGRPVAVVPSCPAPIDLGWPRIRAANEALAIDAETVACGWDGADVDYGMIVGHLVAVDGLS